MHIDEIYATDAFRLLAQGMKDRKAVDIVFAIKLYGGNAFDDFERWCSDVLEEQEREIAEAK